MAYVDIKSNEERTIIDFLTLGLKNVVVLGHYSYKETKKQLKMHQHIDMLEICYLDTGTQNYKVGNKIYPLKGGDILITPPNVVHGTSDYPEEKGSLFWMIIKVPSSPFKLLNLNTLDSSNLIERLLSLETIHFKGSNDMKKLLTEIFTTYNKKDDPLRKIVISNNILSFILMVIKCGEKNSNNIISSDMLYCCKYIEDNVFNNIYIDKLAKIVNLSESRFKHKFKEEVGTPPNEFILKTKINKAKELISKNQASVTNIAYDLGFSTPSYFSTVFKKYQGVTPSKFLHSSSIRTS